ncbi:MAG: GNAT family N-acetyltransferase [Bacteroidetes bacterium]|nr:GNAT family N-acetyltransferase [Bacteroidota bacterium]
MNDVKLREAKPDDLPRVLRLLELVALPRDGVADHLDGFLLAENQQGSLVGSIALEYYGETALVRSAAVAPDQQRSGLGSFLLGQICKRARGAGVKRLVLLTMTAGDFFRERGFRVVNADAVNGPVRKSSEFQGACPDTATCMEKIL